MNDRVIDIEPDGSFGRKPRPPFGLIGAFVALVLVVTLGRTIASAVLDYAWFAEVGQTATWWKQAYVHTAPIFYATLFGFAVLWLVNLLALRAAGIRLRDFPWYRRLAGVGFLVLAWMLAAAHFSSWRVAAWMGSRGVEGTAWRDPVFGQSLPFYYFDLPFYSSLASYLTVLAGLSALLYWLTSRLWSLRHRFGGGTVVLEWSDMTGGDLGGTRYLAAAAVLGLAAQAWLGRYSTVYDKHPFLTGVDYVASHVGIPLATAWAVGLALAAVAVSLGRFRPALAVLLLLPVRAFVPGLVNSFYVRPNEITLQKPFIENHLQATRDAFGLSAKFKELEYKAVAQGRIDTVKNAALLDNVRLWDWKAFHDTVSQIQPLRPYTFIDTDVDRYRINGKLQQVMISPRELEIQQLGEARNRWPNRHVIYTHGYGIVAADANRITADGLPRLFIQDAPPKVTAAGLKLTRPEIYYGEVEHEPVFVKTSQPEFNYPSGAENVHSTYEGDGGIPVGSLGMRLAATLAYSDWNILLTSYLKSDSRMMMRRKVGDRLENLAPFLEWEDDPYLVITPEGKLVWIIDGFVLSNLHPAAEPVRLANRRTLNYIRNSVKATVDAYTGETRLYVFDESDRFVKAYQQLFPDLLRPASEMPAGLREHVRYPEFLFRIQAEILSTYHMRVPDAFYNKVDVWDLARRSRGSEGEGKETVDSAFVLTPMPGGSGEPEFLLTIPFTPRGKDNLIGMLIARNDGEHFGELALVSLPKEELFFGPMQVESRINQDQNISKDLTLWNQQGSRVLHGQMSVIPIDNTFLYVQPIYLQSSQARMPQMKKVVLAYGNELIYTDTYEEAVARLSGGRSQPATLSGNAPPQTPGAPPAPPPTSQDRLGTLRQWMDRYRKAAQAGQWAEAGKALEAMEAELKR